MAVIAGILHAGPARGAARDGGEIDPRYLSIADCPHEPSCEALVLQDDTELNNEFQVSRVSRRRLVKLFTEQGVAADSDIEVTEIVGLWEVRGLTGRTILADGRVIPLGQDNIRVKTARKSGRYRARVQSAHFPGVVPGAIIECSYDLVDPRHPLISRFSWEFQEKLPILNAALTVKPGPVRFAWLKAGVDEIEVTQSTPSRKVQRFSVRDVPSLPVEPLRPSDAIVRARVLLYSPGDRTAWLSQLGAWFAHSAGGFLEHVGEIPARVKTLIRPGDTPAEKMNRIYAFVQQEIGSEEDRVAVNESAKVNDAESAGDVLARGFGNDFERTMLFLAMVHEAGLQEGLLLIAGRSNAVLDVEAPDERQFNEYAAAVKTGNQWSYFDPVTRYCPPGLLAAEKEGGGNNAIIVVPGKAEPLTLPNSKNMGLSSILIINDAVPYALVTVPFSPAMKNVLTREASVKLAENGTAMVEVTERGTGQVDLDQRAAYGALPEDGRLALLAGRLHEILPQARIISAEFLDLESFEKPASIHYQFTVPDVASPAGGRLLLKASLFDAGRLNPFTASNRRTPVYFPHMQRTLDRTTFEIPDGYVVAEKPERAVISEGSFLLMNEYNEEQGKLVFARHLELGAAVWPVERYAELRGFFEKVLETDHQVVVLRKGGAS